MSDRLFEASQLLRSGTLLVADAAELPLADSSIDLIVTSPPYYRKRDYGVPGQLGQEATPAAYVDALRRCLREWARVLRPSGSVFLNVGDTFVRRSLAGIPGRIETDATAENWLIRNRIIWTKTGGMPDPASNRLTSRHEFVLHLTRSGQYYYDLHAYAATFGNGTNPGDVWSLPLERNMGTHLAPFPSELVRRAITLACPAHVCAVCSVPQERIVQRTAQLDPARPQARRAMQLAEQAGLTEQHFAAIRATGVSDTGKALRVQIGAGRNSATTQLLADEAKAVLGGYFREFTFGKTVTAGFSDCGHGAWRPGVVLDPFAGTGTTVRVADSMSRVGIGVDLHPHWEDAA